MSDEIQMPERWHVLTVPGDCTVMGAISGESPGVEVGTGWVRAPDEVNRVAAMWEARGMPRTFGAAAPHLMRDSAATGDGPVFFWRAEEKVLGRRIDAWNQKQVGCCVGFGTTRAVQNLMFWEIAAGQPYDFPGAELCPEITYAGSRHEIGKDRIRGDGSVGVWAAEFVMKYGVLTRGKYDGIDLTEYDEAMCRLLGNRGVPDALEPVVKQHPVTAAALVTTEEEAWAAVGAGKPIAVCSDQGFGYDLVDGFCEPQGRWDHCMHQAGRFVSPKHGPSGVIGNNWNGYLKGSREFEYVAADGSVQKETLPIGFFCTTMKTIGRMVGQKDSSAFAGLSGWAKTRVDYEL